MLTRKELESYGVFMTDEQWLKTQQELDQLAEDIWEEEHPLDD